MKPFNVYIGYDAREHIAATICKFSIEKRCPGVDVKFLKSQEIPEFVRPRDETQATDFTYTRFMIPSIENYKGFSIFCDCDFLFLDDIENLFDAVDKTKAVSVVKHPQYIPRSNTKMDGVIQRPMRRKNWASLMVLNNDLCRALTPKYVNAASGSDLHQFGWLWDDEIGSISLDWNTLDDYYELDNPRAIHYTDGGPWFTKYMETYYTQYWLDEYDDYRRSQGAL